MTDHIKTDMTTEKPTADSVSATSISPHTTLGAGINWNVVQPEKKWTILRHQVRYTCWVLYTCTAGVMMGFDFSVAGMATAFPAFQRQFGIPFDGQDSGYLIPAYVQSLWSAATYIGLVIGSIITGQLLQYLGRKHTVAVGSVLTAVGVAMQIAANTWTVFFGGKLFNSCGFGIVFYNNPVWVGENTRPELRGFFLCFTNFSIVLGQFICALVSYGAENIDGEWSYQTLVVLQMLWVAILLFGYPFFPESPYFLVSKEKYDQARKSLIRIHGPSDMALIDAELERLKVSALVSNEASQADVSDQKLAIVQCFEGVNLARTLLACLPIASQQLIGSAFVLGYVTYFMSLLNITDFFTVNVVLYVVMLVANFVAFFLVESLGRRALLICAMGIMTAVVLLMGIMGCVMNSVTIWVIVVCIFLWAMVYQMTIGAAGFTLAGELPSLSLRPVTMSLIGFCQGFFGWLIGFVSPYMINPDAGNLGAKVGFIFAGLGLPLTILFLFVIPETRGLSYARIDALFQDKVPYRHFK